MSYIYYTTMPTSASVRLNAESEYVKVAEHVKFAMQVRVGEILLSLEKGVVVRSLCGKRAPIWWEV
jgi:hypothetical protein